MVTDDDLIERLASLQASIDGLREDTLREGRKRDVRIRTNRIATWTAIAAAVVGIIVGVVGIKQIHEADSQRQQRTLAACQQANVTAQNIADASKADFDAFIDLLVGSSRTPPPLALVNEAKAKQHDAIQRQADKSTDAGGLHRDCSPAGIRSYYAPKH